MTNLDELIVALEAVTEGSVDRRIGLALGITPLDWERLSNDPPLWFEDYTTSLDAALTLQPECVKWVAITDINDGRRGAHVWMSGPSGPFMSDGKVWSEAHLSGEPRSLRPLAIVSAALKTRKEQRQKEQQK